MNQADVWSYGGGKQSVAIAVLIAQGRLPIPEVALIADTGREKQTTWDYLDRYVRPLLAPIGLAIEVVPHTYSKRDLFARDGGALMPTFTPGGVGRSRTFCSSEWKEMAIRRRLRELGYGPARPVRQWLGISVDEVGRAKSHGRKKWISLRYPLLFDVPMRRDECVRLILDAGLPEPAKSSCWMCPNMRNADWRWQRDHARGEFRKAVELDAHLRTNDPLAYVHQSGRALPLADLGAADETGDLFGATCEAGYCFV